MSTWEQRMAEKAAGRAVVREAEEITKADVDPHRDHHRHLGFDTMSCSCGEALNAATFVNVGDWTPESQAALSCHLCGAKGVSATTLVVPRGS